LHQPHKNPRALPAALFAGAAALLAGCGGGMRAYNTHHALYEAPMASNERSCKQPREMIGKDGFGVVQVSPAVGTHHRPLMFDDVADSVSVQTGHRVMYAFEDAGYFFANVKIERSNPLEYERDKEVIVRQLRTIDGGNGFLGRRDMHGMPVFGSETDTLDRGGTIGIHTAFLDADHVVVTVYLLNQGKKNRRFNTIEEYRALRDRFLDDLTACVASAVH
jgi:hypothetical protein